MKSQLSHVFASVYSMRPHCCLVWVCIRVCLCEYALTPSPPLPSCHTFNKPLHTYPIVSSSPQNKCYLLPLLPTANQYVARRKKTIFVVISKRHSNGLDIQYYPNEKA
ncbi:hypothetical protein TSMEX_010827 [Taenia solium]|eukprot:TsM_000398900 transcript=TsM_000398900 gene=TsM_000398900